MAETRQRRCGALESVPMDSISSRPMDYWRVNSYGYPSPFSDNDRALEAWSTFLSFFDFTSYSDLKDYWGSTRSPRRLNAHAVESWKATFEEFGLLYVVTRSDRITITPAGRQFRQAGESGDENEFARIGLTLLMRYPLRGPRRAKSPAHDGADLLLYRFVYAALRDLNDYIWWPEIERILCRVFSTSDALKAVQDIRSVRSDPSHLQNFDRPAATIKGGFYNSLNQVVVHAGMNHMLLIADNESDHYGTNERKRRHIIDRRWLPLVRQCLGGSNGGSDCQSTRSAIERLPAAPTFAHEQEYFDYLGAAVSPVPTVSSGPVGVVSLEGEAVAVLRRSEHYDILDTDRIVGSIDVLCQLSRGQRIILSHNEHWTFIVVQKEMSSSDKLSIIVRRARPISDITPIQQFLEGTNG